MKSLLADWLFVLFDDHLLLSALFSIYSTLLKYRSHNICRQATSSVHALRAAYAEFICITCSLLNCRDSLSDYRPIEYFILIWLSILFLKNKMNCLHRKESFWWGWNQLANDNTDCFMALSCFLVRRNERQLNHWLKTRFDVQEKNNDLVNS